MISDTLVQLQGLVKQNHLHNRTQTRKMVGLAAQQKNKETVDWFFAQFLNPPTPDFSKNYLNEDLVKIVVNSQWDYAWGKITEVLCTQKTSVSLNHLLDTASPNPLAVQCIMSAAIDALAGCPETTQQKEIASSIALTAVRKNLPDAYNAVVKYGPKNMLYKSSFYWDLVLEMAIDAGSLWIMDVLVENQAPSKFVHQMLRECAPLYPIEKIEHMYNSAKSIVEDLDALNCELIASLSQRFVEPQTATFLQKLIDQTPCLAEQLHSNKTVLRCVLRWCAGAVAFTPHALYQNVVDSITVSSDLVKPLQTVLDNADGFEEFVPLLKYWSIHHSEKLTTALEDVVGTKKTTSKVAQKLLGEFSDAVDLVVVTNWNFNKCEEVSRIKLKWNLEQATAEYTGSSLKRKM